MKYIAVIGFGVVGGGITEVINQNASKVEKAAGDSVCVKYILDLRDFPDSPYADRVIHSIEPILADPVIELVCETMGGSHPAYEYSIALMEAGKSVVTSNKEVVANYGDSLLKCAAEHGVQYMFEASVGGGIPVIRTINTAFAGDRISKISGILNGTTNYILTRMKNDGLPFDEVLAEAQMLGYAERNPSADIDGIDAKRKIIILTALACGVLVSDSDVYAESLRHITLRDHQAALRFGGAIRLIAQSDISDDGISLFVCPMIVPWSCSLAHISDVYNGIMLTSPVSGDIMLYGRGAGRMPTAGAVVADVCAVLGGAASHETIPEFKKANDETSAKRVKPFSELKFRCYIRAQSNRTELYDAVISYSGDAEVISDEDGYVEIISGGLKSSDLAELREKFAIESVLRIKD